ncbi:ferredoxin [Rhodococcus sp. X156]|uniref:ferredoxin n=1 Tax=Rhodococcus sp. X156 TaxID=2499145 RepID=UPI000FDA478A|nr:ferredoxin [Rhodococcus sp. X156]
MKIEFNENACASTGMCEAVAPDLFEIGDDGYLHILDTTPADEQRALVEEAVSSCPTGALSLAD